MEELYLIEKNTVTTNTAAAPPHSRLIGLDIIRAVAIILVVCYHSLPILTPLNKLLYIGGLINKTNVLLDWIGPLGVDLFFVLSGFLIGTILISSFLKCTTFTFIEIRNFWIRRWFRTLPAYYFLLTTAFILYHYLYNTTFNWRYYFFIQNFTSVHPQFFGEAWSLAVEEWFYLTLPVFLLLMSRVFKSKKKDYILRLTFLSYLFIFIILRFLRAETHPGANFDSEIRKVVLFRLDSVMYGVIVAYLMRFHKQQLFKFRSRLLLSGIIASSLLIVVFFWASEHSTVYRANQTFRLFIDSSYFTLIPFFFSLLIPAAYFLNDIKPAFLKKTVLHVSLISYSMYLVHYALIFTPFFKDMKVATATAAILYYVLYWVVVIIISTINYNFFEKPITQLRELLSKREQSIT